MDNSRQQLKKQVKKHIPKDWLCELRIAYRILMELSMILNVQVL